MPTRKLIVLTVIALSSAASGSEVVFEVRLDFQRDAFPFWSESVMGTITADVETNSILSTDLRMTGLNPYSDDDVFLPARSPIIVGDGWDVSRSELSISPSTGRSVWSFAQHFFPAGGRRHRLELLPDGQAILSSCPFNSGGEEAQGIREVARAEQGEMLPHICHDWDAFSRDFVRSEARVQLTRSSSESGFLVGVTVPEPSSIGLLLIACMALRHLPGRRSCKERP